MMRLKSDFNDPGGYAVPAGYIVAGLGLDDLFMKINPDRLRQLADAEILDFATVGLEVSFTGKIAQANVVARFETHSLACFGSAPIADILVL